MNARTHARRHILTARTLPFTLALLFSAASHADALSDLRARLQTAKPSAPLSARIELRNTIIIDDDGQLDKVERGVAVDAIHDSNGIRLSWSPSLLDKGRVQKANSLRNPDAPKMGGLAPFDAGAALDMFDAAPDMLSMLEGATLIESRADKLENQAVTLLALKMRMSMPKKDQKRLKKFDYTAKLWLDTDGWPLAVESHQYVKSSWMLMSFTTDTKERRAYGRAAGRLFAKTTSRDVVFEGFGSMRTEEHTVITVAAL